MKPGRVYTTEKEAGCSSISAATTLTLTAGRKLQKLYQPGTESSRSAGLGANKYVRPKTVQDCQKALNNYRSALQRIWPWDWTAEVSRAEYYMNFSFYLL